jgi:hypothetical protein
MTTYVVASNTEFTVIVVANNGNEAIAIAKSMYVNKFGDSNLDDMGFVYYLAETFFGMYGAQVVEFVD